MVFDVWMMCVAFPPNNGPEAVVRIGRIVYDALGAVRLVQPVLTLDLVTVPGLPGLLVVARVRIFDAIAKFVIDRILFGEGERKSPGLLSPCSRNRAATDGMGLRDSHAPQCARYNACGAGAHNARHARLRSHDSTPDYAVRKPLLTQYTRLSIAQHQSNRTNETGKRWSDYCRHVATHFRLPELARNTRSSTNVVAAVSWLLFTCTYDDVPE